MKTKLINIRITSAAILLFVFSNLSLHAQQKQTTTETTEVSPLFLGLGLGINDYGFGGYLEVPLVEKLSLYGNIGTGGWGYKLGAGITFFPSESSFGSSLSVGYAYATGLQGFETDLTVEPNNETESVELDLNPVGTVNFVYSYNWHMAQKSKFVLSAG